MSEHVHDTGDSPAREYYTAQEIADLALEWGASATITDHEGAMFIELERDTANSSIILELGGRSEFYSDMICRAWLSVPSAPHQFCDKWNEFPYIGAFSVVYDQNKIPEQTEVGFTVRVAKIAQFDRYRKHDDIFMDVIMFWYSTELAQRGIMNGHLDFSDLRRMIDEIGVRAWWLGEDADNDVEDM